MVLTAACRIHDIDLAAKHCPCPSDWFCDQATDTCTQTQPIDADAIDAASHAYRDAVIADLPLAYWRLDDSDVIARDQMAHYDGAYSGTCTSAGGATTDGDAGKHFDGSSCVVTLPDALGFPGVQPYSVEAWIREAATGVGFHVVFTKETRSTGPVDGYALVDSSTGVYFERSVNKSAPTTAHTAHAFGRYVHLVGVYDGTQFMLYIDGVPGPPIADVRTMATYSIAALIGANDGGTDYFTGDLDEIAVYDHALTSARVTLHHQLGVSGP